MQFIKIFFIRGVGSLSNALVLILISNLYGEVETGEFVTAGATSWFIAIVSSLGVQRYILFQYGISKDFHKKHFESLLSFFLLLALSIFCTGIILLWSFNDVTGYFLLIGSLLLLLMIISEYNICVGKSEIAFVYIYGTVPLIVCVILFILWFYNWHEINVFVILFCAVSASLGISYLTTKHFSNLSLSNPILFLQEIYENRQRFFAYWLSSINDIVNARMFALCAPFFLDLASIGRLSVIFSIAAIGGTILQTTRSIYGPKLSKYIVNKKNIESLRNTMKLATIVTSTSGIAIFVPILFYRNEFVQLFNLETSDKLSLFICIIAGSQIIRLLFGLSEVILSLSKGPLVETTLNFCSTILVITIVLVIGPQYELSWVLALMFVLTLRAATARMLCMAFLEKR